MSFNTSHVTLYPWSWPGRCSRRNVSIHHMLLFIESRDARTRRTFMVSIHHMLLFIDGCLCCYARPYQVSIHHMLLFIEKRREDTWSGWCFNTSHVTLYHKWCWSLYRKKHVSIHHMLLFIWKVVWSWANLLRFNTSHVTLYHNRGHCYNGVYLVSIHHMLLFIPELYFALYGWDWFQYITCYSLSRVAIGVRHIEVGFNTSHVTLYLLRNYRTLKKS